MTGFRHVSGIGYEIIAALYWDIGRKRSGWRLTVPIGFRFESSVPRIARWIVSPRDERFLKAAAVHDYLLVQGYRKAFAAGEWHDAVKSTGVPWWLPGRKWRRLVP